MKKSRMLKMLALGVGGFVVVGACASVLSKKDAAGEVSTEVAGVPTAGGAPVAKASLGDSLEFGKPTLKPLMGNMSEVLVEAKNKGPIGLSCTVTATFKQGENLLGAAHGAVNDLPASGTKTLQLMTTDAIVGFDTVKLETSACFPSTAAASAAGAGTRSGDPLKFGKPTVKNIGAGMGQLLVEATNSTGNQISCTVTATFKKGDEILNTANGALNEVPAGGTKTAQLLMNGSVAGYDGLIIEASSCF